MRLSRWAVCGLPVTLLVSGPAAAQVGEGLVVQTAIPQDYERGRNRGVEEQPRPDYAPVGVRFGSMFFYPRVEAGAGGTSNTYLTDDDPVASPIVYLRPSGRLVSDWSRHLLQVSGTATLRNYLGEARRNERIWNVNALGRLEVTRQFRVDAQLSASQAFENLFAGEVTSTVAALSRYRRDFASLQTTYVSGRGRAFVVADVAELRFLPIPLLDGGRRDQSDRDRQVARLTGQIEYARSPSISLFAQLGGSRTHYDRNLLTGGDNLDSKAARVLVGTNVDIAGRIRGTLGVGYTIRDYDAAAFQTVQGLSIESRLQLFPTERLTVTATGQRTIEDSSLNERSAFWNTRFSVQGDYELLRNLIVNANGEYANQKYIGRTFTGNTLRTAVGGRYSASRRITLQGSLSYSRRSSNNDLVLGRVSEARLEAGIAYQL